MNDGLTLLGDLDLIKALKELDRKVQGAIARKACRAAAKMIAAEIKATVSVRSGTTRKAVRVRAAPKKKGRIRVDARIGAKDFTGETFYAAFVEMGHKTGKRGSKYRKQVLGQHKIEAAYKAKKSAAEKAMRDILAQEIQRAADRY